VRFETRFFREIYDAEWTTILTFDAVFEGLIILYCCYVLFEFLRKKPIVPRLMIILYSMNLLGIIIETCLLLTTVEAESEEIMASYWSIGVALGVCLIWIPYFKMSVRVENTFSDYWRS
jgi:ABC-type multidrug transport system permease subunit